MKLQELEKLEKEINAEAFEAFYHVGQKLLAIKRAEGWREAGFKSWAAYCASGRIDYGKSQADRYIQSAELRPKLPQNLRHDWTQYQLLELCKCETDTDAKRVAKKAISLAKKTKQRVTAKLIAEVRDGVDETGKEQKRRDVMLDAASLGKHLDKLSDLLLEWRISLEQVDLEQWSDLDPVTLTRVRDEARKLHEYLEI